MSQAKCKRGDNNSAAPSDSCKNFIPIPNPYNPYDIESGMLFYRKNVIEKIKKLFHSDSTQKLIVIQGYSGSGKTSTLRKMADDPTILGDACIPIYLKPGKNEIANLESFLLFIHRSIKGVLENYGISIEGLNISNISLPGLQHVINRIGFKAGDNRVIVLIFDDFEKIPKSLAHNKNLLDIINLLRYLLTIEQKFRLIIAGAGQLFDWATGTELKSFLNTDIRIDLESLDEKLFESLIADPVKKYVNYTPEAIEEIKSITGMNLYCQQLLCFYIVNFLNEKEKALCTNDEVRQAIINTINDQREDFSHFWNSMSYESKIIAAAFTDENIVKQKGTYYFLEKSIILTNILNKETFKKTLKQLEIDRYINRFEGKRFVGAPYKVPLFGEWVKKHHSFPKTIVDNWKFVIDRVSLGNMGELLNAIPPDLLPMAEHTTQNAIKLAKTWDFLRKSLNKHRIDKNNIEDILNIFCGILNFKIKKKPEKNKSFYLLDTCSLNLTGFAEVRAFFFPDEDPDFKEVNDIQEEIQQHFSQSSFFSFLFCIRNTERINELIRKEYLGIILITEENMKNLALSQRAVQVFKENVIIPQVKPSRISKYQTHGPATITFYGRHDELGKILGAEKKNFAIVGARKIGKTSLLHQVAKKLPADTIPIYMDLENPRKQDYNTFMQSLQHKLADNITVAFDSADALSGLKKLIIESIRKTGKSIIFLLDEIDILMKFDKKNKFQMIKTFRGLYQEGYCQFILSGFEHLSQAAEDIKSPLYNFCEFIRLGKLKEPDARALISEPMKSIGMAYDNLDDRDFILQYTSCHPNLLQFFCKNLVEQVEQHDDEHSRRTIYKEDILNFYESFDYESYIQYDFYLFSTKNVKPIERLIVLLLLDEYPQKEIFSILDIDKKLRNRGISLETGKLTRLLRSLRLRYILQAVKGRRYRFALPAFPVILKKSGDLESFIRKEIEHAGKSL
jgi:GTPase SAR1 family protein